MRGCSNNMIILLYGVVMYAACCVLRVACCVLRVACYVMCLARSIVLCCVYWTQCSYCVVVVLKL